MALESNQKGKQNFAQVFVKFFPAQNQFVFFLSNFVVCLSLAYEQNAFIILILLWIALLLALPASYRCSQQISRAQLANNNTDDKRQRKKRIILKKETRRTEKHVQKTIFICYKSETINRYWSECIFFSFSVWFVCFFLLCMSNALFSYALWSDGRISL